MSTLAQGQRNKNLPSLQYFITKLSLLTKIDLHTDPKYSLAGQTLYSIAILGKGSGQTPIASWSCTVITIVSVAGRGGCARVIEYNDLAPPTIGSVHFFHPHSTPLVKGLVTQRLLDIWRRGKVQTEISVLGVLPPFRRR